MTPKSKGGTTRRGFLALGAGAVATRGARIGHGVLRSRAISQIVRDRATGQVRLVEKLVRVSR